MNIWMSFENKKNHNKNHNKNDKKAGIITRVLATLLALVLAFTMVPGYTYDALKVHAIAAKSGNYAGFKWELDSKGNLTISGTETTGSYKHDGTKSIPWTSSINDILTVTITAENLSDTSYMFYNAVNLQSVDITNWNSSTVTDMSYMFYGCKNLKTIDVSGLDMSSVKDTSFMFYGCSGLVKLAVDTWDVANITKMKSMFEGCTSLSTINPEDWDVTNVQDASGLFAGCNMKTLDLSDWDTDSMVYMYGMFKDCQNLTTLRTTHWNTFNITSMADMFSGCIALKSLNNASWVTTNVTTMANMFYNCQNLSDPGCTNWDVSSVTDLSNMFYGCSAITSLKLSGWNTHLVTNMSGMFRGCDHLTDLQITGFDTSLVNNMSYMFYDCDSLNSLGIPSFNTANVTNMSYMFGNCRQIRAMTLSGWNTAKLANVEGMFMNCAYMKTSIRFTGSVSAYTNCFANAATDSSARIIVYYGGSVTETIALSIVGTKSSNSNVFVGADKIYGTATFNANGGYIGFDTSAKITTKTVELDGVYGEFPTVRRAGYTLDGWYTDPVEGTRVYSSSTMSENTTLYAHWVATSVSTPTGVTAKSWSRGRLTVSWNKPTGASGYQVRLATNKQMVNAKVVGGFSATKKYYMNLTSKRYYYVQVRAYKLDSTGIRVYSGWSSVKTAKVK